MPRQIKRRDVEWDRASCQGIDTELFYEHRTGLIEQGLSVQHLRRICMDCPIKRDCFTIGVTQEAYGFWGGLSDDERRALHARRQSKILDNLRQDFKQLGLDYEQMLKDFYSEIRIFSYLNERKL